MNMDDVVVLYPFLAIRSDPTLQRAAPPIYAHVWHEDDLLLIGPARRGGDVNGISSDSTTTWWWMHGDFLAELR
jgi:hypothetical protein